MILPDSKSAQILIPLGTLIAREISQTTSFSYIVPNRAIAIYGVAEGPTQVSFCR